MRCLLCQTLRSLCDKAPPWVNNEWSRPISSKFDCIFCFLNMKEDRSSRGNEPFRTRSQSLLSTSQLINRVKYTWQPGYQVLASASLPTSPGSCVLWVAPVWGNMAGISRYTEGLINAAIYRAFGRQERTAAKSISLWKRKSCVQILNLPVNVCVTSTHLLHVLETQFPSLYMWCWQHLTHKACGAIDQIMHEVT